MIAYIFQIAVFSAFILLLTNCTTPKVFFKVSPEVSGGIQPIGKFDAAEQPLDTKEGVDLKSLQSKMVRLGVKDSPSHYWFFPNAESDRLEITANKDLFLKNGECDKKSNDGTANFEIASRFILKAGEALVEKNFSVAAQTADSLIKIAPTLSVGYRLKGLALLQQGRKEEAKPLLQQALTLNPNDEELKDLSQAL